MPASGLGEARLLPILRGEGIWNTKKGDRRSVSSPCCFKEKTLILVEVNCAGKYVRQETRPKPTTKILFYIRPGALHSTRSTSIGSTRDFAGRDKQERQVRSQRREDMLRILVGSKNLRRLGKTK